MYLLLASLIQACIICKQLFTYLKTDGKVAPMTEAMTKKRDKEASIQKLLQAGVTVFSALGYDAATTKLIAKEAGINESLISRYFSGKAGLLVEIIRRFKETECANSPQKCHPQGETLEAEILAFFQYKLEHYVKVQSFLKVVVSRSIIDIHVAKELQKMMPKGGSPKLRERLEFFQKQGIIRPDIDLDTTCFTISHTCFAMGFLGYTVMGLEKEYILKALTDFARDFSVGVS